MLLLRVSQQVYQFSLLLCRYSLDTKKFASDKYYPRLKVDTICFSRLFLMTSQPDYNVKFREPLTTPISDPK